MQSRPSGILVPSADNFQISASVLEHLRGWGEGIASAPRIWRHIAAMVRDGRQEACIHKMHSMANGPSDHNFHGRLVKMLKDECDFGSLITGIGNGSSINSMVRPSVMFSWLHRCNRRLFKRIFGANKVTLRSFWERLFSSESGREFKELHPFLRGKSLAELSVVIPLILFTDAGPYGKRNGCDICCFGSVICEGTEIQTKYVISVEIVNKADAIDSAQDFWDQLWADFETLASGLYDDGTPIARDSDGTLWGGCLLFNKADFERLVLLGRPSYSAAAQICGECFADRDAYPFSDLSRHATWRPTAACMTNEVYVARHRQSGHPMADWPILSKYFHRLDTMYAIDHNGVCGVLIGSIWRKLVKSEPRLGTNQQARLNTLNGKMQEYFDNHVVSCRLPKLLLSNLVDKGGWSNLSGPLVKAANVRHSTPFVEVLCREFFDDGSVYHRSIVKVISYLNGVIDILYSADWFLTDSEKAELSHRLLALGRYHMICRDCAREAQELHFAVRPKAHYVQHLADQCDLINSRFTSNYAEESLVGRICKIFRSTANGRYHHRAQSTVLLKYLVYLAANLEL